MCGWCAHGTGVCFNKMVSWLATCMPPVKNMQHLQRTCSPICSCTGQPPCHIEVFATIALKRPHGLPTFKSWPSQHMDYLHAPRVSTLCTPLPQWEPSAAGRCACIAPWMPHKNWAGPLCEAKRPLLHIGVNVCPLGVAFENVHRSRHLPCHFATRRPICIPGDVVWCSSTLWWGCEQTFPKWHMAVDTMPF